MADARALQFLGVAYGNSSAPQGVQLDGPLVIPYGGPRLLWVDASGNFWEQYLEDLGDGSPTLRLRQVTLP